MNINYSEFQDSLGNKVVKGVCLVVIVCVIAFGVRFALFAMNENGTIGKKSGPALTQAQKANAAFQKAKNSRLPKDWEHAAELFAELFEKNPTNGTFAANIGYCLHAAGKIDEAIAAHKVALTLNQGNSIILYNLACAYSLNEEKKKSLKYLKVAIKAGFKNGPNLMSEDGDFAFLKDDPDFKRLERLATPKKVTKPKKVTNINRQFDFWIGSWNVYSKSGKKLGHNIVSKSENGFLITENWTSARGNTGTSMNFVDPKDKKWKQIWINQSGDITRYSGQFTNGSMKLTGTIHKINGRILRVRVSFTLLPNGRIRQFSENSTDQGTTWRTFFEGFYRKDTDDSD